jgi:hypothetical protein
MEESILLSTKKALNIVANDTSFDPDIIMYVNGVFSTLNQLGIGPTYGFQIEDSDATWDAFLEGDLRLNDVKVYIYLRVRLLFDPPTTGFHTTAMQEQIKELEWRINTRREDEAWTLPAPVPLMCNE